MLRGGQEEEGRIAAGKRVAPSACLERKDH